MAGIIKRKGGTAAPVFIQTTCWIMLCWFVLLSFTLGLTLRYSLTSLKEKIDDTLRAVVTTIATSPAVLESLENGTYREDLVLYLDDLVEEMEDLDIITIADENSVRIYHVNKERIDRGIYLLQRTEKTVQEIAAECGIQDVNYFIKLFKKQTGFTPNRYRSQAGT